MSISKIEEINKKVKTPFKDSNGKQLYQDDYVKVVSPLAYRTGARNSHLTLSGDYEGKIMDSGTKNDNWRIMRDMGAFIVDSSLAGAFALKHNVIKINKNL